MTALEPALLGIETLIIADPDFTVRSRSWELIRLDPAELWYRDYPTIALDRGMVDDHGVPLREVDGELHYHPVQLAQRGLKFVDLHRVTGDTAYLEHAVRFAERLVADAHEHGEAIYLPYTFDRDLHRDPAEHIEAPWFSGMAQGQAMSFFLRLEDATGESRWREAADRAFASFLRAKPPSGDPPDAFTALVDDYGYYWVEEYPMDHQDNRTLNGFIFGVMGLYEYWLETRSAPSRQLLEASLTTLQAYLSDFRVRGQPSLYCLQHEVPDSRYHEVHVEQLSELARITTDGFFGQMHSLFRSDHGT